jgi:hypothetical protein
MSLRFDQAGWMSGVPGRLPVATGSVCHGRSGQVEDLRQFRTNVYQCFEARHDTLFELLDGGRVAQAVDTRRRTNWRLSATV